MRAPLSRTETPALILDSARLAANILRMQTLATSSGIALRPHIKTHKSLAVARMQFAAGAAGITAAKTDEALRFIAAGFTDITVAYPLIDRAKLERLLGTARDVQTNLRLIVDSSAGVTSINEVAARFNRSIDVLLKIDVGLHRCGIRADDPALPLLVGLIGKSHRLRLVGIISHAGHAYGAHDRDEVTTIARTERETMLQVRERLIEMGVDIEIVSVGSTPTVVASESFEGITEIRPGNYVFMDGTQLRLGVALHEEIALTVVATVVSAHDDHCVIDAGSKVLSSDRGPHGTSAPGYGLAYPLETFGHDDAIPFAVTRLSEEHGVIEGDGRRLAIGSKVRIIPNHSCVVANLAERFLLARDEEIIDEWPVDARGMVL